MIQTIADVIKGFIDEEVKKLNSYNLTHGPTIGEMYEGLSSSIINYIIPSNVNLRVVSGFIVYFDDTLSGQIDCMIVNGIGELIPYSNNKYKYKISDVIAIFEVKKNLYGNELKDSFEHLRGVSSGYYNWIANGGDNAKINVKAALSTFSKMTGVYLGSYDKHEFLSQEMKILFHSIVMMTLAPVSIVIGYNGYSSENGLRQGLINYLSSCSGGEGKGAVSFPSQIICGNYSLVRMSGNPYLVPIKDGFWNFYASTNVNPVLPMAELLLTKICGICGVGIPEDDERDVEIMRPFIDAKPVISESKGGWEMRWSELNCIAGKPLPSSIEWNPTEVDNLSSTVFVILCEHGTIDVTDSDFVNYVKSKNMEVDAFVRTICETGFVAMDGNVMRLTTESLKCVVLNEKAYVAEDNNHQLTNYLHRKSKVNTNG